MNRIFKKCNPSETWSSKLRSITATWKGTNLLYFIIIVNFCTILKTLFLLREKVPTFLIQIPFSTIVRWVVYLYILKVSFLDVLPQWMWSLWPSQSSCCRSRERAVVKDVPSPAGLRAAGASELSTRALGTQQEGHGNSSCPSQVRETRGGAQKHGSTGKHHCSHTFCFLLSPSGQGEKGTE